MKDKHIIRHYLMKLPEPFASKALTNAGVNGFEPFIGNTIKEA